MSESDIYPFHMPGHKRRGIVLDDACWLNEAYRYDITEIDGFDDLQSPSGIIADIEERLASLYKVRKAFLSVNGSTCGNLAAISALVPAGGVLLADEGAHRSVHNATILRGCRYTHLKRESIPGTGLTSCVSPDEIENKLMKAKKDGCLPDAVLITSPTYEGFIAYMDRIADIVHEFGLPFIADSAHGAHFTEDMFHADVTVVSLHKTLPAMTQVSAVLVNGEIVKPDEIKRYINMFQTTSPSYVLMSSAERCINIIENKGAELRNILNNNLDRLYSLNSELKNLYLTGNEQKGKYGIFDFDRSKINLIDRTGTLSGSGLYDILRKDFHLQPEKAGSRTCLMMAGIMDTDEGFDRLINAVKEIDDRIK